MKNQLIRHRFMVARVMGFIATLAPSVLLAGPLFNQPHKTHYLFWALLDLPRTITCTNPLKVYFNGKQGECAAEQLSSSTVTRTQPAYDPAFTLYLEYPHTSVYMLFTQYFNGQSCKLMEDGSCSNLIEYLKLAPDTPYRCFKCTRVQPYGSQTYSWQITDQALLTDEDGALRIPYNTFIILLNPALIDTVLSVEGTVGAVIQLPTIRLKSSVTQQDMDDSGAFAVLSAVDHKAFHKLPTTHTREVHPGLVVSMVTE